MRAQILQPRIWYNFFFLTGNKIWENKRLYTHEQKGISERYNLTALDGVKTMLNYYKNFTGNTCCVSHMCGTGCVVRAISNSP